MNVIKLLPSAIRTLSKTAKKNAPVIFTGVAAVGAVLTPVLTAVGTWKACKKVEALKKEKEEWSKKDTIKTVWPYYISPAVATGVTLTGIFGSNRMHVKREAALLAACSFAETTLDDYKKTIPEVVGEKKATEIHDAVAKEQMDRAPLDNGEMILVTGKGDTLCFDPLSGRYFMSSIEELRRIENELNRVMLQGEDSICLNQYYYELGLDPIDAGKDIGWNITRGRGHLIRMKFTSKIAKNNQPCIVVNFEEPPTYDY